MPGIQTHPKLLLAIKLVAACSLCVGIVVLIAWLFK
jgi:hypothetical protein